MDTTTDRDDRTARGATVGSFRRARMLAGAVAMLVVVGVAAPAAAAAGSHRSAGGGQIRSQAELAQAALEADDGNIAVIVTAVDFVDAELGPGTNTAVDVFFSTGECVATGPIDFEPNGLRSAKLNGELTAECFDREQELSFSATVNVDLSWVGFGRHVRIRFPSAPDDPCRSTRFERRATTSGTVTIDGPDGGIQATALPTGHEFDGLARQRDICRVVPAT